MIATPNRELVHASLDDVMRFAPFGKGLPFPPAIKKNMTPPVFSPSDVAGLVAWYEADFGVTGTTEITAWADQASSPHNLTKGTTGPVLNAANAAYNNKPTINFTAAGIWMKTSSWVLPATATIVLLGNAGDGFGSVALDGATTFNTYQLYRSSGTHMQWFRGVTSCDAASAVDDHTPHLWIVEDNGASSKLYEDGALLVTGDAGSGTTPGGISVGAFKDGTNSWRGDIAALLIYDNVISGGDRALLETHFNTKYVVF